MDFGDRKNSRRSSSNIGKRNSAVTKKVGHSQKEQDQFFYVKELELSNGLLYAKISDNKESEL